MKRTIMTLAILLAVGGGALLIANELSEANAEPISTIKVDGYSEADVANAIAIFRQNCRPLGDRYWGDVTEVRAEIFKESAPHRLERGFTTTMHLSLRYADDPQVGPAYGSQTGVLAGHTLHYDLGGGPTPGYFAIKRSSQYLCGLPFTDGSDFFVDVPELSILDRD